MVAECCKAILEKVKADTKNEAGVKMKSRTGTESRTSNKKTDERGKGR